MLRHFARNIRNLVVLATNMKEVANEALKLFVVQLSVLIVVIDPANMNPVDGIPTKVLFRRSS